jgi:multicomponent Na+:H+ antiporter subunit D
VTQLSGWVVAVPLLGAIAGFMLGGNRWSRHAGMLSSLATMALSIALTVLVLTRGTATTSVGGWDAPLGITLRADGLAAAMILLAGFGGLTTAIYAAGYFRSAGHHLRPGAEVSFWPLFLFLWAGVNALFLAGDIFNVYVALELMTLAAVAMVVLTKEKSALAAALRYLLAAFAGSLMYLLGVALLYGGFHTLDMTLLAQRMEPGITAWVAVALITTGLALKCALFPLHFWLPRAHAGAPAPVSAMLSSLVVTAAFYLVLRLWVQVFPAVLTHAAATAVGILGAAAILWGSIEAVRQQRLKVMVAYSTVAQVGYLFLILPLIIPGHDAAASALAWHGGLYHAISHALAKAAMFLAAGSIAHALGSDRIVGVSGIATHLPISTYAFGIAGISLAGLPPSGGFVAKWMLLSASLASGQWWWAVVILAGGVLTAAYVFIVLGQELSQAEGEVHPEFAAVPKSMEYTALALALAALLLGLRATELTELLEIGSPFAGLLP